MKKLVPAFMLLVFALAFSGCEMPSEPVQISEAQYRHLTCDEMSQEQLRIKAALAAARDAQRSRSDFGMGGNFNGIPINSRSSGLSTIDTLNEQLHAVQQAASQKGCPAPRAPDEYLPDESPK
jgi:hypothetical protein